METEKTPEITVTDVSQPIWEEVADELFIDLPDSYDSSGGGTLCIASSPSCFCEITKPEAPASA